MFSINSSYNYSVLLVGNPKDRHRSIIHDYYCYNLILCEIDLTLEQVNNVMGKNF